MISKKILSGAMMLAVGCVLAAPPPAADWVVPKLDKGSVKIEQFTPDILAIHYELTPDTGMMNGNYPRMVKDVDLMLAKPMVLSKDTERVIFDAYGVVRDTRNTNLGLELRPIIRDRDGELFYFFPKENVALKRRDKQGWDSFVTAAFHSGEAGAASHGTCIVGGNVVNSRPDGQLELVGFQLHLTQPDTAGRVIVDRKGTVYLGQMTTAPLRMPFARPNAFAGAFLKDKGTYTLAGQIRTDFQATPVKEFREIIAFDPNDIAGSMKRVEFDLGGNGHYWIDYQILDEKGGVVVSDSLKHQVFDSTGNKNVSSVDLKSAPVIGYMRVNPGQKGNGVYEMGEAFKLNVRVFPKDKKDLKLSYVLHPFYSADVLASGEKTIGSDAMRDIALEFPKHATYNAFRLVLNIEENGKKVDSQTYVFGEKTDFSKKLVRKGMMTDRNELKKRPNNRLSYVLLNTKRWQKPMEFYVNDFRRFLEETREFTPHGTVCPALNDFEVLPGVFDFSVLDAMMELAADYGYKFTVRFAHSDLHDGPYRWGKFSRQISADGIVAGAGISYGAYEVTDPDLVKLWLDSYRALFKRYSEHCAFAGYYIMMPAGEWIVVDQPWDGVVSGYSPVAAQGFRDYLQGTLKLSLAELNKRWNKNYRDYSEVQPPMPTFEDGIMPDLRMEWLDFSRFKAELGRKFWMATAVNDIRTYDDKRLTITYGSPNAYAHLSGKLDYCHNGGNHSLNRRGAFYNAWKKDRIGYMTEPIHPHGWAAHNDPGKGGWVLDVSTWTMLAQAGGGGANLHIYYYNLPGDMIKHYGGFFAFDRFERFKSMLRELHGAELLSQPSEIAVNHDPETLYTKHRTTFGARLEDLKRWFELLEKDGIPYVNMNDFPEQKFKLYLPNILDEVISLDSLNKYKKVVSEDGARMIIAANTGKYVPETGLEPYQLLKALGISTPDREYVQNGHITAKALDGNPLFESGQEIAFQTLTTMHEQAHSPEVRKAFWRYPYRWIPETDYFGYYPGQKPNGKVLARFADGGAALSLHQVGKGEVMVFWGTPDISADKQKGMMARAAEWAKVNNPLKGMAVPDFIEMTNTELKRHYGLAYLEDKYGTFEVKFPHCPDGDFFCDEMVADKKIGRYNGKDLREKGLKIEWKKGESPLKAMRIIPINGISKEWVDLYNK